VMGVQTAALFVIVEAGRKTLLKRVMGVADRCTPCDCRCRERNNGSADSDGSRDA
jgi:hypothetical protein